MKKHQHSFKKRETISTCHGNKSFRLFNFRSFLMGLIHRRRVLMWITYSEAICESVFIDFSK